MARLEMRESRRGTVTLETALVLPLLLLLTFALIEYGWLFLRAQEITNGARQGARTAVRPDATNADVQASISAWMEAAGIAGYLVTLSPEDVHDENLHPGDPVTVTITVAYDSVRLMGLPWVPVPQDLRASVSMAKEGP